MLRTYFQETFYDMPVDIANKYAEAIRDAIRTGKSFDGEKKQGYFISKNRSFVDKLYVGNIHRIENHLYWNDEELAADDQIINVVVIDGPVTRDGDGCSYGSKDHRDQILYANTIPQVVGHIFIINTPGGACSARIDYEQAIADCREKGKATVAWVDGMCCSAGQLVASLCDRTIVMNGRHTMGCIGTMCAFWGVSNGTVDSDGYRYIELVSVTSPDKNAEYREACDGKTEKLQAELDMLGEEFRETVKANRPLVKEEHLTGKTFDAQDVMGALVDEIGDYERAIEAVFELAGGTLPAARTIEPENPENTETPDEPEQPQNNKDMKEEEMMAAEAEAAQAAATETPETQEEVQESQEPRAKSQEQETTAPEAPAEEAPEVPAEEAPAEQPSAEAMANAQEEIDKITETLHNAEALVEQKDKEIENLKLALDLDNSIIEDRTAELEGKDKTIAGLKEALEANNVTIAERDKTIEEKDQAIKVGQALVAERDKTIEELNATIEEQKKQLAEKEEEIKEMANNPAPMTDATAGVPANNGAGDAPQQSGTTITRGMSYEEIREARKQQQG